MENIIKSDDLGVPLFQETLSWKKELRMFNWKDIRQISKSQKVKGQKVYFSTFRFFEIQNEAFLLFNFSTFRNWKWHRSTFWLFDFSKLTMKPFHFSTFYFLNFPVTCSTFSFSFSKLSFAFTMEEHLLREKDASSKKQESKSERMSPRKHMLCLNPKYIQIQNTYLII